MGRFACGFTPAFGREEAPSERLFWAAEGRPFRLTFADSGEFGQEQMRGALPLRYAQGQDDGGRTKNSKNKCNNKDKSKDKGNSNQQGYGTIKIAVLANTIAPAGIDKSIAPSLRWSGMTAKNGEQR